MVNLFCYFLLGTLWGSSFPLMKIITPYIGASWMIEFRSIFGAVFLSLILIPKFPKININNSLSKLAVISACKLVLPFLLVAKASETIQASVVAVLFSIGPILSAVLTMIIEKKRSSVLQILGLILGFSGVAILLIGQNNNHLDNSNNIYPMSLVVLAAFIYSIGGIYTYRVSGSIRMSTTATIVVSLWISSIMGLIFPIIFNTSIPNLDNIITILPHTISLGCLSTGFANLLYFRLIKVWGAVPAISVVFTVPVFSMFWCSFLLNEAITVNMLICSVLIIVGSMLVVSKN